MAQKFDEGIEKEIVEGKKEVVINCLKLNLNIQEISKFTGLSTDEIEDIRKTLK